MTCLYYKDNVAKLYSRRAIGFFTRPIRPARPVSFLSAYTLLWKRWSKLSCDSRTRERLRFSVMSVLLSLLRLIFLATSLGLVRFLECLVPFLAFLFSFTLDLSFFLIRGALLGLERQTKGWWPEPTASLAGSTLQVLREARSILSIFKKEMSLAFVETELSSIRGLSPI